MSQCDIDSDSGPFGYIVFCTLETKRTHFPFKHFPFYPPHSGVCRLIPSPCLYPLDQPSSELCFIIPFPPSRFLTHPHFMCLWSVFSQAGVVFTHRSSCT